MNEKALQPAFEDLPGMTPAERINYHYQHAERHFSDGMAHALQCGWELSRQKAGIGWGRWKKWVKENLSFSLDRADRLIALYDAKLGAERERIGVAPEWPPSKAEVEAVLGRTAGQSVTAVMIGEGIRSGSHSANWGGDRREAAAANGKRVGRPASSLPEGDAAETGLHKAACAKWAAVRSAVKAFFDNAFDTALSASELRACLQHLEVWTRDLKTDLDQLESAARNRP